MEGPEYVYPRIGENLHFTEPDKKHSTTRSPRFRESVRKFHNYLVRKIDYDNDGVFDQDTIPEDTRDDHSRRENQLVAVVDKAKSLLGHKAVEAQPSSWFNLDSTN